MTFIKYKSSVLSKLKLDWKRYFVVLVPLIFSFFPILYNSSEARCAYVILVMSLYFMTEALPLAVTALIPVFAFPMLGIISTEDISRVYMRGTAMMFFGGLVVAIAVEHCNLHKRIALFVILKIGQSPRRLMVGFMLTAMFLSMWISNTAATAMMVPILDAILQELYKNDQRNEGVRTISLQIEQHHKSPSLRSASSDESLESDEERRRGSTDRLLPPTKEAEGLSTMYYLALAYGANLGGTGTPTGASPNLVFWGILQSSFPGGTGLNFASWMAFNVPGMILNIVANWIWLEILFLGVCGRQKNVTSAKKEESIRKLVESHYESLGRITFHELSVAMSFGFLVFLWIFRAPDFIDGWADQLHGAFINDFKIGNASPAILVVFLLFVLPSRLPWADSNGATPACLTWDVVHQKVPWGLILLMGGGFAMAEASSASGMSELIKHQLQKFEVLPGYAIVFLVCLTITFLTEIVSNATAASIFLPVLRDMAIALRIHPLYLMLPGAISCSYAFMLPVSNPPNAIVFEASTMKNSDMLKAGVVIKLICVVIINILINTLGVALFDLHNFPDWANPDTLNVTLLDPVMTLNTSVYSV